MKFCYPSLKNFHTFQLNITAKKIVFIKDVKTLTKLWQTCQQLKLPLLFLGEGSNTIFSENYHGIIAVNKIQGMYIKKKKNWLLHVYGGTKWHQLVKYTIQKGIYGLENLALIPGSVGAAPIQNIGAYGVEFKNICNYVDILVLRTSQIIRVNKDDCYFDYRNSIFKNKFYNEYIILAVGIKLPTVWLPSIQYSELQHLNVKNITAHKIFRYICHIRKNKLPNPKKIGNAGSFFKNPIINKSQSKLLLLKYKNIPMYIQKNNKMKISAGWLIEQCHLKNYSLGGAAVYNKQALVLINKFNSTPKDVISLARLICNRVKKKFNINLEPEVQFIDKKGKINLQKLIKTNK